MIGLSSFERYYIERILDLSDKISKYTWKEGGSYDFLVLGNMRTMENEVPDEIREKVDMGIEKLLGCEEGMFKSEYHRNPVRDILNDCYRIELRKEFIEEMKNAKQTLEEMLDEPQSKSRKKEIRYRIKKIQKRIDDHLLGTKHIFLTHEDVQRFKRQNNIDINVFEYMSLCPLLNLGDKFQDALDVLEKADVPNIQFFKELSKQTKRAFFDNWISHSFVPHASVYLISYKEEAIEDVIRKVGGVNRAGEYGDLRNPSLNNVINDDKVKEKIKELELPLEETLRFLGKMGYGRETFEYERTKFLRSARDFYRKQLTHKDKGLQWIAVKALSDSYYLPTPDLDYIVTGMVKEPSEKEIAAENSRFKKEELSYIVETLEIKKKYPRLAQRTSLLAERFLRFPSDKINPYNPYDLETMERLIPLIRTIRKIFPTVRKNLNLYKFTYVEQLGGIEKALNKVAENFEFGEYNNVKNNKYFNRAISEEAFIEILKGHPGNILTYFDIVKEASIKLSEMENIVGEKNINLLYETIFNSWHGLKEGKEDYILGFIDLFLISNILDGDKLYFFLGDVKNLAYDLSSLEKEQRIEVIRKFKVRENIQNNFGFADYMTQEIFDKEVLPIKAEPESIERILEEGFFPTIRLIQRYEKAENKEKEIELWKEKKRQIANGNFSIKDEIMVDIEYTNFRKAVNFMAKPTEFKYDDYLSMILRDNEEKQYKGKESEIDFLCVEANKLLLYLREVKKKSEEAERELLVVQNYSYGAVALLPIEDILRKEGFRIIPARIGSSECHDNKEYIKSKLFPNGINKEIITNAPNIVVVDGTPHLEPDFSHKAGRYPDSHRGYMNYIIVVNDILTDNKEKRFAKNVYNEPREVQSLRHTTDYENTRKYIESKLKDSKKSKKHYKLRFWNPAGLRLKLRSRRIDRDYEIIPEEEFDASHPTMIIANSVMPSLAMPKEMVEELGAHIPAYFDDHYETQEINFKVTPTGVRYSNLLEERIKQRYKEMFQTPSLNPSHSFSAL